MTSTTVPADPTTVAADAPSRVAGIGSVRPSDLVRALDAVMPHASTDAFLPMLNAVKIETRLFPTADGEAPRLVFVATDRYTLGTYSIPWDGGEVSALLSLTDAKELHRFAKGADKVIRDRAGSLLLDVSGGQVCNVNDVTGRRATYLLGDGATYVKWQAVMPGADYGTGETGRIDVIGVNPVLLAKFAKAAGKGEPIRLQFGPSAVKPVRITVGDFVGLIMPVRLPDTSA